MFRETVGAISQEVTALRSLEVMQQQGVDILAEQNLHQMTEEQRALAQTFFVAGPDAHDSAAAVAAALRVHFSVERRAEIRAQLEPEVMRIEIWDDLNVLAQSRNPSFNARDQAGEVRNAIAGWEQDEDRLFRALDRRTPLEMQAMRLCYAAIPPGGDMDADVRSDLSGAQEDRAVAQMGGDQSLADAAALREAMHGGLTGLGTDEDAIYQVLRNRTPEEREAIRGAYLAKYGEDLQGDLESELSGGELDRANALMQGLTARADAIAIDEAMHGTFLGLGLGTDEDAINAVYETNRQEVQEDARRHPEWSQAQVEAAIRARSADVELQYNQSFGAPRDRRDRERRPAIGLSGRAERRRAEPDPRAREQRSRRGRTRRASRSRAIASSTPATPASTPSSRGRSIARSRAFVATRGRRWSSR